MSAEIVSILEGDTFVVSDRRGDVVPSPTDPHGLFHQDTRFLSHWQLTVNGHSPRILSTDDVNYFSSQFFLVPPAETFYDDASVSIIRKRSVGDGFHEDLTVLNHTAEPIELDLRLEAAADFADLFEVKDALAKKGEHYTRAENARLVLGYRRDGFVRETWISATADEADLTKDGIRFRLRIEPQGQWTTCVDVLAAVHGFGETPLNPKYGHGDTRARPNMPLTLEEWREAAPELDTDWRALERTYERSLTDLAALRFFPRILPGMALPAAGLPWFMTVFGRDSLMTSYQALPYAPELAEATLRVLAVRQGTRIDHFRDEEPGKILHEIRFGEMTAFEERPHSPYYGTADATPLFLVLLDEYVRWTSDIALGMELEDEARAALRWIDEHGDRDGDGYVEYERRNSESGLENQCWKDSHNSILFADGSNSSLPRACCEIQGYVYDAKRRSARLAREVWGAVVIPAAALVSRLDDDQWRLLGVAALVGERAAIREHTPGDVGAERRKEAGDRVEPPVILPHAAARDAAKEADRVRMAGVAQNRLHRSLLHEAPCVEHADPRAHLRDDAEVVADEEHGRVHLLLERGHEVEHLGLDGRVEPSRRLVENEELGVLCERHRDDDALLHPAGELMRVARHDGAGIGDLDGRQRFPRSRGRIALRGAEHGECLGDLRADSERRVQRRTGALVDHRDGARSILAQPRPTECAHVAPGHGDRAARDAPVSREVAHDRERHGRLPAPRLPDETVRLPRLDRQRQAANDGAIDPAHAVDDLEVR